MLFSVFCFQIEQFSRRNSLFSSSYLFFCFFLSRFPSHFAIVAQSTKNLILLCLYVLKWQHRRNVSFIVCYEYVFSNGISRAYFTYFPRNSATLSIIFVHNKMGSTRVVVEIKCKTTMLWKKQKTITKFKVQWIS